jgi:hypothetical protein
LNNFEKINSHLKAKGSPSKKRKRAYIRKPKGALKESENVCESEVEEEKKEEVTPPVKRRRTLDLERGNGSFSRMWSRIGI